jgi:phenylacetate-coenzyme A ligase PaaK-like adenylate-forming protein
MEPVPALVGKLNDFQPAVLGSYPTALAVLAEEQEAKRLRISPALVLSGAERLSLPLRERIASSFRCAVRDTYAASEFMGIAFDCRHGSLHVNADWVILEPVDAAGGPVAPGEASFTTLLTNLANLLQPLIRYDLGDSVTMVPGPCRCGSPLPVIRPEGRTDEILRFETHDGSSMPLLPLMLATVVEETPGLSRYQVIRSGPRAMKVRIEEAPGADREAVCADVLRRLGGLLSSRGLDSVSIRLSGERPQAEASGGKMRQFLAVDDFS